VGEGKGIVMPYYLRNGSYIFRTERKGGYEEQFLGPIVALIFDRADGKVLKHGSSETLHKWMAAIIRLMEKSEIKLIGGLTLIEGKFPVEELNKCVENQGYITKFYRETSPVAKGMNYEILHRGGLT